MATEVYGKGASEYGILGSILAVGSLGGSLLAARRETPHLRLVISAAAVFGLLVTMAGLMPSYLTFALVLPLCGFSALTMITTANAYMQMAAAPQLRGRVMALYLAVFMGGTPIGAPLLGLMAERYGARWPLIGGGMLTLAGSLLAGVVFARRQSIVVTPHLWPRPSVEVAVRVDDDTTTDTVAAA